MVIVIMMKKKIKPRDVKALYMNYAPDYFAVFADDIRIKNNMLAKN
jgi:hypothetical protein